jgi:hypothetical protein
MAKAINLPTTGRKHKTEVRHLDGSVIVIQYFGSDPAKPWHIYEQESYRPLPQACVVTCKDGRRVPIQGKVQVGDQRRRGQCRLLGRFKLKAEAMSFFNNPTMAQNNLVTVN